MSDRKYVLKRNKLIPFAERFANEKEGKFPTNHHNPKEEWVRAWNRAFLGEMDRLAKEQGLT